MRDYLTSGGLLDEAETFRNDLAAGRPERRSAIEQGVMPFQAQNPEELEYMNRSMIRKQGSATQFQTPESLAMMKNTQMIDSLEHSASEAFQKKVNNPFFKATDFATDLLRNTLGAPLNFLTDGVAFQSDPSRSALAGYKKRMAELNQLQESNLTYFFDGRKERADAFQTALTDKRTAENNNRVASASTDYSNRTSGSPRQDLDGNIIQVYEDGTSRQVTDRKTGDNVKTIDEGSIHMVNGIPHEYNSIAGTFEATVDAATSMQMLIDQKEAEQIGKRRANFITERPSTVAMIATERGRFANEMMTAMEGARKYIAQNNNGWGGVLSAIPGSDARALDGYLRTIKANVGFKALQQMRDNSPNGGALGNVSELELKQLNAVLGNLDVLSNSEQLLETLDTIEKSTRQGLLNMEMKLESLDRIFDHVPRTYPERENDPEFTSQPQTQPQTQTQTPTPPQDPETLKKLQDYDLKYGFPQDGQ